MFIRSEGKRVRCKGDEGGEGEDGQGKCLGNGPHEDDQDLKSFQSSGFNYV